MSALAGARLLDTQMPGWASLIDVDALDMGNPATCVLGQLCPDNILGRRSLWRSNHLRYLAMAQYLSGLPDHKREGWSKRHGFLADASWPPAALTRDWKPLITARTREAA